MGCRLVTRSVTWDSYEGSFVDALRDLCSECGLPAAVFGDIDLEEHRTWEEQACAAAGINAFLPLWQGNRRELVEWFLKAGFVAMITTVNTERMSEGYLGRVLDAGLLEELEEKGIDACGEEGEYHSVVTNGPTFKRPLLVSIKGTYYEAGYARLDFERAGE